MKITASGLERALLCPASAALPGERTPDNEYSERGRHLHTAIESPEAIDTLPEEHRDDARALSEAIRELLPDDVRHEVPVALDVASGEARELIVEGHRQYDTGPFEIPATVDLWAPGVVGDTKTGWRDVTRATQNPQLLIAACANAAIYGLDTVRVLVIDARDPHAPRLASDGEVDMFDLIAFRERAAGLHPRVAVLRKKLATEGLSIADVSPGEHCRYCPSLRSCPATLQLVRDDISQEVEVAWAGELTPQTAPQAYEQFRHLEKVVKRMSQILYGYAAKNPIQLPSGKVFGKRTKPGKERLDGDIAYPVLKEHLGAELAEKACRFITSKKAIREALREVSARGSLSENERQIMRAIRDAGGASKKPTETVEEYDPEAA